MSALAALQQRFLASVQGRADAACEHDQVGVEDVGDHRQPLTE